MGDIFDQVAKQPNGDIFDQIAPKQSAASPISPPAIQKPNQNLPQYGPPGIEDVPESPALGHIQTTAKGMLDALSKQAVQLSTPGIATSMLNRFMPNAPIPHQLKEIATPLKELPNQMGATMAPIIAGGIEEPVPTVRQNVTRPQPTVAPSAEGPSLPGILARHIPGVGRILKASDTLQMLQEWARGKAAPPAPTPGVPEAIPETAGIPWGTGGQGPLELRGQRIPPEQVADTLRQMAAEAAAKSPRRSVAPPIVTGFKGPYEPPQPAPKPSVAPPPLGGFKAPYEPPTEITAQTQAPSETPQVISLEAPATGARVAKNLEPIPQAKLPANFQQIANSSRITAHGYDPATETATFQYKRGDIQQFKIPAKVWNAYLDSASRGTVGTAFEDFIQGRYRALNRFRGVEQSAGAKVKQALSNQVQPTPKDLAFMKMNPPEEMTSGMTPSAEQAWQESAFGEAPLEDIGNKIRAQTPSVPRTKPKGK